MTAIRGLVPPVVTPFHADGSLDLDSLDRVVEHLIAGGVHGLFILGSSGQVAYLTDEERDDVVRRVIATVASRVPVQVGTPDFTARRMAAHARRAQDMGADAVVVTAPLYALNDQAEIDRHLRMVSSAVDIPVFAYDVPVRVHTKLGLNLLINLGRDGVIAGVKDSSGDDVAFRRLVMANAEAGHPLELLTGHEVMVDGMLLLGADGAVPGLANVDPAGYRRLWDAAQAGDWAAARTEQNRLTELFEIAFVPQGRSGDAGGIGAFKAAMALLGIVDSATMPAPLEGLSGADVAAIREILVKVGLLV
ncbi:MAG: dihydrodipicolinate synthase family protein [Tessaracoccus sp.]|uniref:dihydrodipicolinate synthase family protein n=1 Tax=Tessaracoccus sp. TaxID=1971211 RepID=UPI001EB585A6|nr:dihydrodipicolinate synthase family protein [Tessaracoccus sp.]MBK7820884.1 dihydrodipicolinate synthase family protein [Tessaracoccus sp.]